MSFKTKKSLGQNFLSDTGFINSVLDKLDLRPTDTVVEVGAGLGILTECLKSRVKQVISYEIDTRLEPILREKFKDSNVELRFEDALSSQINISNYKLIANIPYYITTPLLSKFLDAKDCVDICVLVQEEVAKRICAKPNTSEYGALSVGVQAVANAQIIKFVSRKMFRPIPNVDSAFVRIQKNNSQIQNGFDAFLKKIFSRRRKMISNSVSKDILERLCINGNLRPENLSPNDFVKIFHETTKDMEMRQSPK